MDWTSFPREKVNCKLCGSNTRELLSIQQTWPVSLCKKCGLIYLSERPDETALEDMYSKDYYEKPDVGYGGYVDNFNKYNKIFLKLFKKRAKDIRRFKGNGKLLEVGCAHGFLLDYLRNDGWDARGLEVSPLAAKYAQTELNLDVFCGKIEEAGYKDNSFDVILLLDVLEHLHRPFQVLNEIGRILVPGGVLVVQCPWELTHWEELAEAFLKKMKPCSITADAIPAHLYFFGPETLEGFLKKGNFSVFSRQSGNYGAIRRHIKPTAVKVGSPLEQLGRYIYFRLGVQQLFYKIARLLGKGNGLIRYARFNK